MKKKLFLPLLLAGMWATPALAAPYVSGSVGLGTLPNSDAQYPGVLIKDFLQYDSGFAFNMAYGQKSGDFRAELALDYQRNGINAIVGIPDSGSNISVISGMVNGYYDLPIKKSSITPYVMAGLGVASVDLTDAAGGSSTGSAFAWQAGAGVGIKASDNVVVDFGYRYFNGSKPSLSTGLGDFDLDISGSKFLVGVRYGL